MSQPLLAIDALTAGYGTVPIISKVDFSVDQQGIAVIVGPNGAGKSTLLKAVMGLNQIFSGTISLSGKPIQDIPTGKLVPLGIAAVPQTQNVFPSLTVEENLDVGTYAAPPPDIEAIRARVLELFPDLADKLSQPAGELSGGQRQMVAVSRALMSDPKLLLLDEPTAGLSPAYLERIFDLILKIRETGVTIVMVEQNAKQALRIADIGYVLVNGENAYTDTGANLLANDEVRRSFLGGAGS